MIHRLLFLAAMVASPAAAQNPAQVPNALLEVTYRQLQEGKLSQSVHYLILNCWNGECALTTLTLNQCFDMTKPPAFFPKIQRASTQEGDLTVSRTGPTTITATQTYPEQTVLRHQFTFAKPKPEPGSVWDGFVTRLTDFSGAAMKDSEILGKTIAWEWVPLRSEPPIGFVFVEIECAAQLPAVPRKP